MKNKTDIMWLERVDSTNNEARRRFSELDNLSVLSALSQSQGRGQRGNTWSSKDGKNLLFSIVLKYDSEIRAHEQFVVSQLAALSVTDLLASHGIMAKIKWPNDIYVGPKKICGILIENSLRGSGVSSSIIGIGLNINQRNFNVNLPNPTSMAACKVNSGHSEADATGQFDIRLCLSEFMDIFSAHVERFLSGSQKGTSAESYVSLREMYLSRLWRLNETASFIDYTALPSGHYDGPMNPATTMSGSYSSDHQTAHEGRQFTGIIRGLSPIGHLTVEDTEKGELKEFTFKEIGYIL